mgnify:CR=1 FL=1
MQQFSSTLFNLGCYIALVALGAFLGSRAFLCTRPMPWLGRLQTAALLLLIVTLGAELGPEVTVNSNGPTLTVTPMMAEVIKEHPETLNLGNGKPLERIGKVEDCMGPAVFLASEAGAFVTGQILYPDGGLTAIG